MSGKYEQVLARKDPEGEYGPNNCCWRKARSSRERQTGIEDLAPDEPLMLPMSTEDRAQLEAEKTDQEKMMFKIWHRLKWRADNYGKGASH